MGLLDDAIREHLELKRRRGADPAEVAQQEREALGPVRGAGEPAPAQEEPVLAEPEPLAPELHHHAADEPGGSVRMPDAPHEPAGAVRTPDPAHDPAGAVRMPDPEPDPEAVRVPAPEHAAQPTQHSSVDDLDELRRDAEPPDDVVPADDEPPAEDVLDETPDFLQEAPEHDRLWFEQRPPRDFDF